MCYTGCIKIREIDLRPIWKNCPEGCVGEGRGGKVKAIGKNDVTKEHAQTLGGEWGRVAHWPLACGHSEDSIMLGFNMLQ